uniref:Uncharacterized protein n=1 Tax=Leersia perrieri TaxID=77586 RepID=A0A0D9VXB5_9ORYZ
FPLQIHLAVANSGAPPPVAVSSHRFPASEVAGRLPSSLSPSPRREERRPPLPPSSRLGTPAHRHQLYSLSF